MVDLALTNDDFDRAMTLLRRQHHGQEVHGCDASDSGSPTNSVQPDAVSLVLDRAVGEGNSAIAIEAFSMLTASRQHVRCFKTAFLGMYNWRRSLQLW